MATAIALSRRCVPAIFFVLLAGISIGARAADVNPLRPVDMSSPRASLEGFVADIDEAYRQSAEVAASYTASRRLYLNAQERQGIVAARTMALRSVQFLDTSDIPPVLRTTVPGERAIQLKEILDRIGVPPPDRIPDREAMARSGAKRWRLPDTEIDFVLIESGPRAGNYLVPAATVDRLPEFYERVKNLPYLPGPAKELSDLYRALSDSPTVTIFEIITNSPIGLDRIVPTRWMVRLPGWAKAQILGVALWQWAGFAFGGLLCALFIYGAYRLARRASRRREGVPGPGWHSLLIPLAIIIVAVVLIPLLSIIFRIGGSPRMVVSFAQTGAVFLSTAWLVLVAAGLLGEKIAASEHLVTQSLDSQLIRLTARFVGIVIAVALLMEAADELGFPAYSVLAGLGVGGLAIALAARDSLANFLGSVLIMFEKPFRVGHRIRVSGSDGTVEAVGFRSTRIRTADNSLISIPNNAVVNATVENVSARAMFRQRFVLQLTYDTPAEKLEAFRQGLEQLLLDHPLTNNDNYYVRFNEFGDSSLNILVIFNLLVANFGDEIKEREQILYNIMALAKEIGVEFAFPTRTLHVATLLAAQPSPSAGAEAAGPAPADAAREI